jgi:hypothetical protein
MHYAKQNCLANACTAWIMWRPPNLGDDVSQVTEVENELSTGTQIHREDPKINIILRSPTLQPNQLTRLPPKCGRMQMDLSGVLLAHICFYIFL